MKSLAAGLTLVVLGLLASLGGKLGGPILPGDIIIQRGNFTFFFPIVTSIVLSFVAAIHYEREKLAWSCYRAKIGR
ncbi:MAG: DUF2905 domain-containing protein [Candidatus Kerfeldbacteria bacterium]|nr:DUF2905 domain-containing protein [Candidatus Kerfeldbacteria bacterium]